MKKGFVFLLFLLVPVVTAEDFSSAYFDVDRLYYACDMLTDNLPDNTYDQRFRSCMGAFDRCDEGEIDRIVRFLVRPEYLDEILGIVLSDCGVSYAAEYYPEAAYGRAIFFSAPSAKVSPGLFLGALVGVIAVFVLLTIIIHRSK